MKLFQRPNPPDKLTAFRLSAGLLEAVDSICAQDDITRSQLFRRCIMDYAKARGFENVIQEEQCGWSPELYKRLQR